MKHRFWYCCLSLVSLSLFSVPGLSFVTEEDFSEVNHHILELHEPTIASELRAKVELIQLYDDYGGAFRVDSAHKSLGEDRYVVTLTGAVPHSGRMSVEGYAIVACHEMGHILGGAPRQERLISKWSSVEGQADYFATNECMWRYARSGYFTHSINNFNDSMIERCEQKFDQLDDVLGCMRIMSGIQAMVDYFNRNVSAEKRISIDARDTSKVTRTLQKYPSAQCRVDTWMAGLFNEPRPSCWYRG